MKRALDLKTPTGKQGPPVVPNANFAPTRPPRRHQPRFSGLAPFRASSTERGACGGRSPRGCRRVPAAPCAPRRSHAGSHAPPPRPLLTTHVWRLPRRGHRTRPHETRTGSCGAAGAEPTHAALVSMLQRILCCSALGRRRESGGDVRLPRVIACMKVRSGECDCRACRGPPVVK